jgi:hypothetical protein
MILIGSKAIKFWFNDFPRDGKDFDYIVKKKYKETFEDNTKVEFLINPIFDDYPHSIMLPKELLVLKMSHVIGWDINWEKHMFDIQFLLKKGCELDKDLFYNLYDFWVSYHGKNKRSDLEMDADSFFNNALKGGYDHDYLHTLLNPIPTYTKILKDGEEVDVDEDKFNRLSHEDKCNLVTEEVMVMAYERRGKLPYKHAYSRMLKKFILNHAPIWEALFIIENFIELHKPKFNYYKILNENNGTTT